MPNPDKHWFYPSAAVGCGLSIDDLFADQLECLRSLVTCQVCIARIRADKEICEACRIGAPEIVPAHLAPPHVCDPARSLT